MKILGSGKGTDSDQVSLIAENCQFQGEINFSSQLVVNGRLSGMVSADTSGSRLTVGVQGEVVGNVCAPNIIVSGLVKGDIYATEHIELTETAKVSGNLFYHSLQIARGSRCTGSLRQLQPPEIKAMIKEGTKISRNTAAGRLQSVHEKQSND